MGKKCPVFEAWEHKKYLRKNWNSSLNFSKSEYLLVHGPSAQEKKRKEHTRKKKERAEAARAQRLATSWWWDPTSDELIVSEIYRMPIYRTFSYIE